MGQAANAVAKPTVRNGIDVTALTGVVDAIKGNKEIASFKFRARNAWQGADHNRSTIDGFYGACQEVKHAQAFQLDSSEPPLLLGSGRSANPAEYVLHALAACLTTTLVYHAAARAIRIAAIDSNLEADADLRGFLGLSDKVRKGFSAVRVKMRVKSDAPAPTLDTLARFSPVFDIVSNSLPVELVVETY